MTGLLSLIERLATWRGLTLLILLYLLVFGAILMTVWQLSAASGGYGILDFDRGYTVDRVHEVLGSYGERGMVLYRRIQLLDLVNPALYALLLACLTHLLWRGAGPRWVALLPLLGGLGDYAENVTLFLIVSAYPDISTGLVALSSTLSLVKNGLLAVTVLALLAGVVLRRRARS